MSNAIELQELEKNFRLNLRLGRRQALDGLSLSVRPGEIYGFLGPNGAGKTTSIKILVSLLRQDGGVATVFGKEPSREETRKLHRLPARIAHLLRPPHRPRVPRLLRKALRPSRKRSPTAVGSDCWRGWACRTPPIFRSGATPRA